MDLAAGAKRLWVMMEHTTKDGTPELVRRCSYPLTAVGAVKRVYTNLAVLDVTDEASSCSTWRRASRSMRLQEVTDAPLRCRANLSNKASAAAVRDG